MVGESEKCQRDIDKRRRDHKKSPLSQKVPPDLLKNVTKILKKAPHHKTYQNLSSLTHHPLIYDQYQGLTLLTLFNQPGPNLHFTLYTISTGTKDHRLSTSPFLYYHSHPSLKITTKPFQTPISSAVPLDFHVFAFCAHHSNTHS